MLNHACDGTPECNVAHAFEFDPAPAEGPSECSGGSSVGGSSGGGGGGVGGNSKGVGPSSTGTPPGPRPRPRLVVRATRALAAGEECCYRYVPPSLPREERAALLRKGYGFDLEPGGA